MAREIDTRLVTKLAGIIKKSPGNSARWYSETSGIPNGQILTYLVRAEVEADPSLKMKATEPNVLKARREGLRWPRIAARMDISVTEAQNLYEKASGESYTSSYTGRGRRFDENGTSAKPKAKAASGRRQAAAKAKPAPASGRRASAGNKRGAAAAPAKRGKATTRAQANPR